KGVALADPGAIKKNSQKPKEGRSRESVLILAAQNASSDAQNLKSTGRTRLGILILALLRKSLNFSFDLLVTLLAHEMRFVVAFGGVGFILRVQFFEHCKFFEECHYLLGCFAAHVNPPPGKTPVGCESASKGFGFVLRRETTPGSGSRS